MRPSVVFIGAGPVWAGGAGYLGRQRQFIDALHVVANVRLVMLETEKDAPAPPDDWDVVTAPFPRRQRVNRLRRLVDDATSMTPSTLRYWDAGPLREIVQRQGIDECDAVFAYRIDHAAMAGVLHHPRLLLDIDDPEHLRRRRRLEVSGDGLSRRVERDLRLLERCELQAAAGATACFVCQEGDARAFAQAHPVVIPNGVRLPRSTANPAEAGPTIVMLGNFAGAPESPNVDGLRWFVREVWGQVRATRPDARLEVVGRCGEALAKDMEAAPGVVVRGFVESIDDVFANAAASAAPIRFGTGTRVKIIESMAHGCPVVTTSAGCDGLDVHFGKDLLVADDARTMAETCTQLLGDAELRRRVGLSSRRVVEACYDRATLHDRLVVMLANLMSVPYGVGAAA